MDHELREDFNVAEFRDWDSDPFLARFHSNDNRLVGLDYELFNNVVHNNDGLVRSRLDAPDRQASLELGSRVFDGYVRHAALRCVVFAVHTSEFRAMTGPRPRAQKGRDRVCDERLLAYQFQRRPTIRPGVRGRPT